MHFWHQRDITDRLIADRAARSERLTAMHDEIAMCDMLYCGQLPFRFDPEMLTLSPMYEEWDG